MGYLRENAIIWPAVVQRQLRVLAQDAPVVSATSFPSVTVSEGDLGSGLCASGANSALYGQQLHRGRRHITRLWRLLTHALFAPRER